MTIEEIQGGVRENNEIDRFPIGMRVLAVDDDPTCLKLLDVLLRKCQYQVTTTNQAITALKMLRENRNRFDLIISDVHMPDMDGFKLLELVGLEMDLPVIMLSGNSDPKLVRKGIHHGACDYLAKPVRLEELRNVWQHVIRKKVESKSQIKSNNNEKSNEGGQEAGNGDQNAKFNRKRKDEDEDFEENGNENDELSTQKKPRVVWSIDLHRKFVAAVNQLGIEKAVPKRILDLMNVDGLTRENVASHLQKYRLYLKRISHQANMVVAFGGSKDASSYMRMNSIDGLGDLRTLSASGRLPNAAISSYSASGMLGRLNSVTGMTLHSLTSPSIQQNSINALNKFQPLVLSTPPNHQNSNIFHGISSSFDLDHLPQSNRPNTQLTNFNSIDESRIFTGSRTFLDPGVGNHQSLKLSSTGSESFNLVSNSSSFVDQTGCQPLKLSSSSMPMAESFQNGGLIGEFVRNFDPSLSNEKASQSKQDYMQYSNNDFSTFASPALANNGGASTLVQCIGETEKSSMEMKRRSGENCILEEQLKLQGGFDSNNGYGSLDDLMNGMMKREQEPEIIMDGEFSFDPYAFGSCI